MSETRKSNREGGDDRDHGMDRRLRDYLDRPSDDPSRTWSERILDALVSGAVRGDIRAQHEIFRRVGTDPDAGEAGKPSPIDDETARRVLEAVRGPIKDREDT